MRGSLAVSFLLFLFLLASFAGACSKRADAPPPLALDAGCQPLLGGHDCFLPYPSDFYRTDKGVLVSGAAKLRAGTEHAFDFSEWKTFDGSSRVPTIAAVLPSEVSHDGMVRLLDPPEKSLDPASVTVLVDASTGELVAHFADVDPNADEPTRRAITIHPLSMLRPGARYIAAIHGAKNADGSPAAPAEGFRRLREKIADAALAPLADRFESDVFAPLAKAGVARESLQLAWDFTTTSGDAAKSDMFRVRELALAWLASNTPKVTIKEVTDAPAPDIARMIKGTVEGPLYMMKPDAGAELAREASGKVVQNGTLTFTFTAQIPASLANSPDPGRAIAYGHGFFGSQAETEGVAARHIADRLRAVMFGIDWLGMSKEDMPVVFSAILDTPARSLVFTDRVHQAMANWLIMTSAMRTVFPTLAPFARASGAPGAIYDPQKVVYFGASQGHILGGTLAALDPDLSRVVLQVGGAGFSHVMFRSRPFQGFLTIIALTLRAPLDQRKFAVSMQPTLDRIDPATYAEHVLTNKLPGSPADRRVLLQIGLGDVEVPNLAAWLHARLLGIGEISPNAYAAWSVPQVAAPKDSALTVFDFGIDPKIYAEPIVPNDPNQVHEGVRAQESALAQMDRFYADGTIIDTCGGPCKAK